MLTFVRCPSERRWDASGGAGSARPQGWHDANPNIAPSWPPASRKGTGGKAMPCHSSGRTMRARRPRPSEKIAFRVIPWPSTARPSQLGLSAPRSNCLRCQGLMASLGFHGFPVLTMALSIVRSFLIQAVMATFRGLPCWINLS
jgi:hypothetical protein